MEPCSTRPSSTIMMRKSMSDADQRGASAVQQHITLFGYRQHHDACGHRWCCAEALLKTEHLPKPGGKLNSVCVDPVFHVCLAASASLLGHTKLTPPLLFPTTTHKCAHARMDH
eukprot:743168-Pelagomonas_calceolata.AAC.5